MKNRLVHVRGNANSSSARTPRCPIRWKRKETRGARLAREAETEGGSRWLLIPSLQFSLVLTESFSRSGFSLRVLFLSFIFSPSSILLVLFSATNDSYPIGRLTFVKRRTSPSLWVAMQAPSLGSHLPTYSQSGEFAHCIR